MIEQGFFICVKIYKRCCLLNKRCYICAQITTKNKKMLDLNTITKEQFVEELLMSDDCNDFYLPREKQLLNLDFDFEEMKKEFENWLEENCDYELEM